MADETALSGSFCVIVMHPDDLANMIRSQDLGIGLFPEFKHEIPGERLATYGGVRVYTDPEAVLGRWDLLPIENQGEWYDHMRAGLPIRAAVNAVNHGNDMERALKRKRPRGG